MEDGVDELPEPPRGWRRRVPARAQGRSVFSCSISPFFLTVLQSVLARGRRRLGGDRLRGHSGQHSQLARQSAGDLTRCIDDHTDYRDPPLPIGQSHPADDIAAELVQQLIDPTGGCPIRNEDADNRKSCLQTAVPPFRFSVAVHATKNAFQREMAPCPEGAENRRAKLPADAGAKCRDFLRTAFPPGRTRRVSGRMLNVFLLPAGVPKVHPLWSEHGFIIANSGKRSKVFGCTAAVAVLHSEKIQKRETG